MTKTYHCGLVFSAPPGQALNRSCHIAAAGLEQAGHSIVRVSLMSPKLARVTSEGCLIRLSLETVAPGEGGRGNPGARLVIGLTPTVASPDKTRIHERLMLTLLYNMSRAAQAHEVEWLDPDTRLPARRFMQTLAESQPPVLTPELMPNQSPFLLTEAYAHKRPEPQPDLTLSRNLRDVLCDDHDSPTLESLTMRAGFVLSGMLEKAAMPVTAAIAAMGALRAAPARLGA